MSDKLEQLEFKHAGKVRKHVKCWPKQFLTTIFFYLFTGASSGLRQDADDMCMICFTEALWPIPSIQLGN